ncbi:pilus assembly protein PilM [Alkaliphilus serpentinus]|uniref:Type IV pilus assembly protein PilM n=1 Tax=Alkaliphilus serpentinus TaxID=1482731 RepID=A0A833HML0_9FIRM|nr:pilus assembly protein PilM [Alkaliphilus serpentinus]KAB3527587.1 hypothetical protein F8153_11415 [Alkaliphilus serpentinus]
MKNQLLNMFYGPFLSLDIGSHSIKIVEGNWTRSAINIERLISIPTPLETVSDGKITDINKLREAVSTTIEIEKIKAKRLIFTIGSTSVITREIILPTTKPEEIKSILEYELQQYLPVNLDDYILQKKILEEFMESGIKKSNLQVAALPKEMVSEYYQLAQLLKLKAVVLDLNFNSIYKLIIEKAFLNKGEDVSNKTIAVVDIGYKSMNVIIIEKKVLKFNRLIQSGGNEIDVNLANALNLTLREASEKKKEIKNIQGSTLSELEEIVNSNIKATIDNWVYDIERLFKYYTSREVNNKLDAIYLYGGGSRVKGIEGYFKEAFQIPTYKLTDIAGINKNKNLLTKDLDTYYNAIGAMIGR